MSEAVLDTRKVRSWRKYPSYQTIELDWVDRVPDHWIVKRLKWSITACQNGIWGDEPTGDEDNVGCVRVADFDRLRFVLDESVELTKRSVPKEKQVGRLLNRGDLLLEKSGGGDNQPVGALVLFDSDAVAVCSNFVAKVAVADGYCGSYLRYLHACLYANRVNTRSMKQATGIQNLDSGQYFDEKVAFPSLVEQRAIAAFLDRETARIDALVAKKQRLIELLEEKLQAVVSRAVTKGLAPTVDTQDSNLPWYGRFPSHWKLMRVGWIAEVSNGSTPSQGRDKYWLDGTIPWIASGAVNAEVVTEPTALITEEALRETSLRIIPSGSVLMGMIGQGKTRGTTSILGIDSCVNQNLAALTPGKLVNNEYLRYALQHIYEPVRNIGRGGNQAALNCDLIRSIRILLPPTDEQLQIVTYLNALRQRTSSVTRLLCDHQAMLNEYRTALISAAVTGQIDVREEVQLDE